MASYLQAVKHLARGEARRYSWFCGPERRLVEELVDLYRRNVGATDVVRIDVSERPSSAVWSAVNVHPSGGPRLVLVRSAEQIGDWSFFLDWDYDPIPRVHVCFVSNEENTDTKPDHMRVVLRRGRYVRCGPFRRPEHRIEVLRLHREIEPYAGELLLSRLGNDVSAALDVMDKCSYFSPGHPIPYAVVDRLVKPTPNDDFIRALMELRAKEAMEAAPLVSVDQLGLVIGSLDYRLSSLSQLNAAMRKSTHVRDLARMTKLEGFVILDLMKIARRYDRRRVQIAYEALQMVDSRIQQGETELVLETLVTLWTS